MNVYHMSKSNHQKMKEGSLYQKRNGDVFVEFVKPIKLARKMFYNKRSIVFQIPL